VRRVAILLYILFLSSLAQAQLTANFRADTLQGCAPLVVQFTDLSSGNPTSYFWDLGNGTTVTSKNAGTIYFNPGTYTVKQVVRNALGADSVTKTGYIVVNAIPGVQFTASSTNGCLPFTGKFSDQSTAGTGNITKWEWNFGDGTTSNEQAPTHVYTTQGTFNVSLRTTNSAGCAAVLIKESYIKTNGTLKANFTTNSVTNCSPPVTINYTNTSVGSGIVSTRWSFGDNSAGSTAANPSHVFNSPGTYNVKLVVTNQTGCVDSIVVPTVVGNVNVSFTAPDTACQGSAVNIVNTSTPATASAIWQFGDGTTANTVNVSKVFNTPGNVSIKLINNFGACRDSLTKTIFVRPNPPVDFTYNAPAAGCKVPVTATFTSQATGATSYIWDFGDSTTSSIANPSHDYKSYGNYSVRLTTTTANGCTSTVFKENVVSIAPIRINPLQNLPYSGCAPYSHTFRATTNSTQPVASYLWNFGDNTTSTDSTPNHTYSTAGQYDVTLVITTQAGCKDSLKMVAAVVLGKRPVADFSATPLNSCAQDSVTFKNTSTGTIDSYTWLFGDNTTSSLENPRHHFGDTGYFSISLIVGNNKCYDTLTKKNYVNILPPIAIFRVLPNCDTPFLKKFVNTSIGAQTNTWSFGDGTTSTDSSPVHTYPAPGLYRVSLKVTNGNCSNEFKDSIYVVDEHPSFTIDDTTVCKNVQVNFTATNINVANIAAYTWNFGDSTNPVTTTQPTASHIYTRSGNLVPSLTITDKAGCKKTVSNATGIVVFGPTAAFQSPEGACVNTRVTFTNQSQPSIYFPIARYIIDYGDGARDSAATFAFAHTYTAARTYTVSLTAIDANGCMDVITKQNAIIITKPVAAFVLPDSLACNNSAVRFQNTSSAIEATYLWSFGDGTTSTNANPTHAYNNEGLYNVSLSLVDKFGCTDTATKASAIAIRKARASFTLSDSIINCPPALVKFFSTSTFASAVRWDFGDGVVSNVDTPNHYFLAAGTYRVKLVAQGFGACADSIFKTVVVKGPSGSFSYSPLSSCAPASVTFTGEANNNTHYVWDFGDGTITNKALSISHVYTTIGRYLPKLLLQDTVLGCTISVFGKDSITVTGVNANIKSIQSHFCDSATLQFFDSSRVQFDAISSYSWNFGDATVSSQANPVHRYNAPGIYPVRLTVRTANGCVDTSNNIFIKVVKSPDLTVTAANRICLNQPASFSAAASDTSALSWLWNFGNGNTSTLQNPLTQNYTAAGTYSVYTRVTNSSGCADSVRNTLTVNPLPIVDAGADSIICRGQTLALNPSGGSTYTWQSNATLSCTNCAKPVVNTVNNNIYFVTGTDLAGCTATDSVRVTVVQPFSISTIAGDSLCKGQSINLAATGADRYVWTPARGLNNAAIANPTANPDTTTTYRVIGYDYRNCFADTATVSIAVFPVPVFNIVQETINLAVGNFIRINTVNSADIINWRWTPATRLSCNNCAEPVASPTVATTYRAVVSNAGGCTAEDQVRIEVFCNNGNVFVPNTFSPNGDGSNDVFFPRGKGIAGIKNLQIFNRWGQIVFQKFNFDINNPNAGWDGRFNGQPVNQDVFVYQMEVICETGEVFPLKGNVSLIR
jgi:gliding motility-associated-like protein